MATIEESNAAQLAREQAEQSFQDTDTPTEIVAEVEEPETDESDNHGIQSEEDIDHDETEGSDKKPSIKKLKEKFRRQKEQVEQEREYWKQEALKQQQIQQQKNESIQQPIVNDKPQMAHFNTMEEYTDALTDWKFNARDAQVRNQQAIEAATQKRNDYAAKADKFASETEDFQEVMADAANIRMDKENIILDTIMESDVGPQLAYYLAKNESEITRLKNLPPLKRAVELGKLEDKVATKKVNQPNAKKVPAPVNPVNGSNKISSKSEYEMSAEELFAARQAKFLPTNRSGKAGPKPRVK